MKNTIRIERAKKGITQEQLADATGLTNQAISKIERGESDPKITSSMKIAQYFEKNVEDIFLLE